VPALENQRHEAFAKHLASGVSASKAYVSAGYQRCRQNASRLSSQDDIKARVTELKERSLAAREDGGRDTATGRFLPGNGGNGGRPRGARSKLAEAYAQDLLEEWHRSGSKAVQRAAELDPIAFVKIVGSLLPRQLDSKVDIDIGIDLDLYAEVKGFAAAYRYALNHIGADPLLIEGKAESATGE
jgi:hypothetical protein